MVGASVAATVGNGVGLAVMATSGSVGLGTIGITVLPPVTAGSGTAVRGGAAVGAVGIPMGIDVASGSGTVPPDVC
jgi:hypothetical protein